MNDGKVLEKTIQTLYSLPRTGVGGGIVAGGNLIHGVSGAGGEIGHITVDPEGFECTCGKRGCLETVSSATGVVRLGRFWQKNTQGIQN